MGGENLEVGVDFEIQWTNTGIIDNVAIECSIDNGATWDSIVDSTFNDGGYTRNIPGTISNQCLVRIHGTDSDNGPSDVSDEVFSIVIGTRNITVTSPNGGETLEVGTVFDITWTGSGDVETVRLEYSTDNGQTWEEIIDSASNSGSYEWLIPETLSENCLVRISDPGGEAADNGNGVFSIVMPA